jgi:hypothetical protein
MNKMCSSALLCAVLLLGSFVEGEVGIPMMTRTVFTKGEKVCITCSNSFPGHRVTWHKKPSGSNDYADLFRANSMVEKYEKYYSVNSNQSQQWTLSFVILDSRFAGQYRCCDDEGCSKSLAEVSMSVLDINNSAFLNGAHQLSENDCHGYLTGKCELEVKIPKNHDTPMTYNIGDTDTSDTVDFKCNCSSESEIRSKCEKKEIPIIIHQITPSVSDPDIKKHDRESSSAFFFKTTHSKYIPMIMLCYTLSHII